MKTVYLIRHAEAGQGSSSDFHRPLTATGEKQAEKLGVFLKQKGVQIDRLLSSSAKRATETAKAVARHLTLTREQIVVDNKLYLASEELLSDFLLMQDDAVDEVIVVAHNPGLSDLAHRLDSENNFLMHPATLLVFSIDCKKWQDYPTASTRSLFQFTPSS